MSALRFLGLVIVLNVIRYGVGGIIEAYTVLPWLFAEIEAHASYFNSEFTTIDWVTSYFYNFMMWFVAAWLFHLLRPVVDGSDLAASIKVFGIAWLFFASISAIYMNHYSHSKDFYFWNIADAIIAFGVVAVANGLLYRPIMGPHAANSLRETPWMHNKD